MKTKLNKLVLAIGALVMAGGAMAETGNLVVSSTVTAACVIADGTLDLGGAVTGLDNNGAYLIGAAASRSTSQPIAVNCTEGAVANIGFAAGTGTQFVGSNWGILGEDGSTYLPFKLFNASTVGTAITPTAGIANLASGNKNVYGEIQYPGTA